MVYQQLYFGWFYILTTENFRNLKKNIIKEANWVRGSICKSSNQRLKNCQYWKLIVLYLLILGKNEIFWTFRNNHLLLLTTNSFCSYLNFWKNCIFHSMSFSRFAAEIFSYLSIFNTPFHLTFVLKMHIGTNWSKMTYSCGYPKQLKSHFIKWNRVSLSQHKSP